MVTIAGTNLNNLKSVLLNGQELVVSAGGTTLTVSFTVPRAAGTGRLRVTTTNGTVVSGRKLGVNRKSSALTFPTSTTPTVATAANAYSTPTMTDLDGDGLMEMLVGQGDGTMMWYEQTGTNLASFSATGTLLAFSAGGTIDVGLYAKPTVADLDGNGLQEVIVGEENGTVMRYEQVAATGANALKFGTGTTLFANPYGATTTGVPNPGSYARPAVTDLNGNDLLDVLVGGNDGTLHRYEQKTANVFTTAGFNDMGQVKLADGTTLDAGDVSKPLVTDYDGDGKLDMLVGNFAGNILMFTQTGANATTFSLMDLSTGGKLSLDGTAANVIDMRRTTAPATNNNGYAAPAITDIDGDGQLDLFLGNGNGTMIRYEQNLSATSPTINAPLPVVLTTFTGQATATGCRLAWATAQEVNSASFVVEASATGDAFAPVATLAAAGNSASLNTYAFVDASETALATARRYYRLRQVDLDGTSTYSPVVAISRSTAATTATIAAYPNPFAETLSVALSGSFEPQMVAVALTTLTGRTVYATQLQLSAAPQALPALAALPAGVYVLRLTTATGTLTSKVTRQ